MANPTTYFGWVMPTATDLVTDLPADFAVFGQGVDTSMADLLGGTTGQILSKTSGTNMDFTWINNDQGDITAVTAGTGISGGGTSGAVTVSIDTAVTVDKTTAQTLTNKTLTSPALTTPTISTATTNGDLLYGTGSGALTRLGIGSSAQVLTVASGVPSWATPAGGGGMTLITSTAASAVNSIDFTSISGSYKHLLLVWNGIYFSANNTNLVLRVNSDSGNNYYVADGDIRNSAAAAALSAASSGTTIVIRDIENSLQLSARGYAWFYNYAGAYNKQISYNAFCYRSDNANNVADYGTTIWASTSAITAINLIRGETGGTINTITNGRIELWGVA